MSLCESMLQIIEQSAETQGFNKVKTVWLEIGALAGVEKPALEFSFEVVTRSSLAENARLEMIDIPGTAWCMQCCKPVVVSARFDDCPECGSGQLQITGGEEFRIKELEVE